MHSEALKPVTINALCMLQFSGSCAAGGI